MVPILFVLKAFYGVAILFKCLFKGTPTKEKVPPDPGFAAEAADLIG